MPQSLLDVKRFGDLSPDERLRITACERAAHLCGMEILADCQGSLSEDRAVSATIVGLFTALCRVVAQSAVPKEMAIALSAMLKTEVEVWKNGGNANGNA